MTDNFWSVWECNTNGTVQLTDVAFSFPWQQMILFQYALFV